MNTRIRYSKDVDGTMVSKRTIVVPTGEVMVKLYDDHNRAIIYDPASNTVLDDFDAPSSHAIKKLIKSRLIAMGAVFAEEKRNTGSKDEV